MLFEIHHRSVQAQRTCTLCALTNTACSASRGNTSGYFLPHEGANNIALALFSFSSLPANEDYRQRINDEVKRQVAYDSADRTRCILQYKRSFIRLIFDEMQTELRRPVSPALDRCQNRPIVALCAITAAVTELTAGSNWLEHRGQRLQCSRLPSFDLHCAPIAIKPRRSTWVR